MAILLTPKKWEAIEHTDEGGDSTVQVIYSERARIDAAKGWLVRTWTDGELAAQTFVPDDNDMWKAE